MSGNHDGTVSIWDSLAAPVEQSQREPILDPLLVFTAHGDTVNGIRYQ